jgi:ATP-dependent RNA helicase DDX49/DBP8
LKKYIFFEIRELAYQIADQFRILGKPINIKDCVITGGMGNIKLEKTYNSFQLAKILCLMFKEMTEQAIQLADKPHVVIATPGRLADHIESGTNFTLNKIQMLVNIN